MSSDDSLKTCQVRKQAFEDVIGLKTLVFTHYSSQDIRRPQTLVSRHCQSQDVPGWLSLRQEIPSFTNSVHTSISPVFLLSRVAATEHFKPLLLENYRKYVQREYVLYKLHFGATVGSTRRGSTPHDSSTNGWVGVFPWRVFPLHVLPLHILPTVAPQNDGWEYSSDEHSPCTYSPCENS